MEGPIERHLPFVWWVLKVHWPGRRADEGLFAAGCLGLVRGWRAADHTRPDRAVLGYIKCCIIRDIHRAIRSRCGVHVPQQARKNGGRNVVVRSLGEFVSRGPDGTWTEREAAIGAVEPEAAASDVRRDALALLAQLPRRQREIVMRLYGFRGEAETLDSVGRSFGLSRERVRQIRNAALAKLGHGARRSQLPAQVRHAATRATRT